MPDWKNEAIDKLKQYEAKRRSLVLIPREVEQLETEIASLKKAPDDESNRDRMLDCTMKRAELLKNLKCAHLWVADVSAALDALKQDDRRLLERFYIDGKSGAATELATEFIADIKTIYRRKDIALRRFTIALYGCTES